MSIRDYPFSIAANSSAQMRNSGHLIVIKEASAPFEIMFANGDIMEVEAGFKYRSPEPFETLTFRETGGAALTITVSVGEGDLTDGRLAISGSITNREEVPDVFSAHLELTFTGTGHALFGVNSLRNEAGMKNTGSTRVWLRKAGAGGSLYGHPIDPGETVILKTTAGIHASGPIGSKIALWETEYSS